MKRKSIISLLVLCMTLGMLSTSCQDMLTPSSERQRYEVAQDTLYSYWGIIKSLQNVAEKYVILNECRGDLVDGTGFVSDSIKAILNFGMDADEQKYYQDGANAYLQARDYYHIVNSCNAYIAKADTLRKTGIGKNPYMTKEYAQVLAIRAWVYMQLCSTYGKVPFYTKPLLTTDDINNFMNGNNTTWITGEELAEELAPELERMWNVEFEYGYPQYNWYGSNYVYSNKIMFPIAIILGDLYLLQGGSKATYEKSAYWYFKFLNNKYGGVIRAQEIYGTGDIREGIDNPIYTFSDAFLFDDGSKSSASEEIITIIPSNMSKLSGKVNTDICRLFGFKPEMSAANIKTDFDETDGSNTDNVTLFAVTLERQYERELIPSKGYDDLCDAQNYEVYLGTTEAPTEIITLEGVGDARRYWTVNGSEQYTFTVNEKEVYGKMVTKQSRYGFSPYYPVLYRKSTVWLRYAEALNRAGFPSYAFAILKNGLCKNTTWYPGTSDKTVDTSGYFNSKENDGQLVPNAFTEWEPKTFVYNYVCEVGTEEKKVEMLLTREDFESLEELKETVNYVFENLETINEMRDPDSQLYVEPYDVKNVKIRIKEYQNYCSDYCTAWCWYLSREEVDAAKSTPFLDFESTNYLRGNMSYKNYYMKQNARHRNRTLMTKPRPSGTDPEDRYCMGIHERGCGFTLNDHTTIPTKEGEQPEKLISSYDYVKLVQEKIKANTNEEYTKEQIYADRFDQNVVEAVEDLILDEMGLELAFEGCRFSDIERIAKRRSNPTKYFADHVAKRGGELNSDLWNHLQTKSNWYLPLPKE